MNFRSDAVSKFDRTVRSDKRSQIVLSQIVFSKGEKQTRKDYGEIDLHNLATGCQSWTEAMLSASLTELKDAVSNARPLTGSSALRPPIRYTIALTGNSTTRAATCKGRFTGLTPCRMIKQETLLALLGV